MLQHTIRKEISISGVGMHSGKNVRVKFIPAKVGSGITFMRSDLPGRPRIKADLMNVSSTVRGTSLSAFAKASADKGEINTVEHVLSALYALSVTNLYVELNSSELPALDGSSKPYCDLIMKAGIIRQGAKIKCINVIEPVFEMDNGKCLIALPSDRFMVSFMINYPIDFIGTQFYKFELNQKKYVSEIAPARTYGFMDEVTSLKRQGLAFGASFKNAVAIAKDGYITRLRFKDELVRHKILDLIGDLSLLGAEIKAHIIAIRSGHDLNIVFAKKLKEVG
jgi:UDP-3-O-[3-hydroxymyristoyl] N-acetylglucosamine deacetylase